MNFHGDITGTLAKSELKFGQSGKPFWRGRVAINHKGKNQQGTYEETGTTWVSVVVFGHLAENAASILHDKALVKASGRMETRFYQKDDGSQGQSLEMVADSIGLGVAPWPDKNQQQQQTAQQGFGQPATGGWDQVPAQQAAWG